MSPPALRRTGRFIAATLLLAAGIAGARSLTFAPSVAGKPIVLEGRLDVLVEDYSDGHSRVRHFLDTSQGRVELAFARKAPSLSSGTRVRVHGQAQGEVLALDGSSASIETLATVLPNTMGEQSIAVLLVNFQDDASQPRTLAEANDLVFGTTSNHYRESSFGQTWFKGDTFGWYTIAMSKTECDPEALASLADAQAAQAGVNLAAYQRRVYMFPKNSCPWAGLGVLGGTNTQAWVNSVMTLQVVGHELGHNNGLYHAHAYDCDTGVFGDFCSTVEYGDAADLMGNGRPGQFGAFEKEQLGWLNDGISPPITTVTTSGRYSIEPYSAATVGPKALKVLAGTDGYGRKVWYYLEYRQPIGGDSVLATTGNVTQGLIVRVATQGDGDTSYQLDMSPGSSTKFNEMADGALAVGQTYVDEAAGVILTLAATSSTGASVDVSFVTPCRRAAPVVSLVGSSTPANGGSTVDYTVNITNRDSSGCPATTFTVARSVPAGWTGTLGATSVAVLPGATASVALGVTSPTTAVPANYGIGAAVGSPLGSRHTASGGATYTVADPATTCTRAAPSISLTGGGTAVAAGGNVGYTMKLTSHDSSACPATTFTLAGSVPDGWTGTLSRGSVTLAPGAATSATLTVTSSATAAAGSYGIGAAMSSPVGALHTANASATNIVATTLSVADTSVVEGNTGTRMANFTVSLAQPTVVPVTFDVATRNGTAAAGSDYIATSRTGVTIPAGSTRATVSVPVTGDLAIEGNETFQVVVGNLAGATVSDGAATATLLNDDTTLSIGDVSIVEGQAGTRSATFTVRLTNVSASPVGFNITTANRTATGSDYVALGLAGQSIPAGSTSKVFNVAIKGDTVREANETFVVNVGNVSGAIVADAQALGTIVNDD